MYCTVDDLRGQVSERILISMTDDENERPETMTPLCLSRIEQAIKDAGGRIDAYCQGRYQVPFSPVPQVIRSLCVDIAVYNIFARRGFDEDSADKAVVTRYKDAIRFLEQLAAGRVTIGVPQPPPAQGVQIVSRPSIMGGLDNF